MKNAVVKLIQTATSWFAAFCESVTGSDLDTFATADAAMGTRFEFFKEQDSSRKLSSCSAKDWLTVNAGEVALRLCIDARVLERSSLRRKSYVGRFRG